MNNGGPAFPALDARTMLSGMTLRDYFAAKAMQGIISASGADRRVEYDEDAVADNAYRMADAMLKERER